jgi:FkbM family methyltransferase
MIIEIGTSDFHTEAGQKKGLFIEPVKYYFERLPNCLKENVAISNIDGETDIYYVTEEDITEYNKNNNPSAPLWLKGCASINDPHPTLLKYFDLERIRKDKVKIVKIKSLIDKYEIKVIDYLKIDTEGHDCIILNNFLDEVKIFPKTIQFEYNSLSNLEETELLINRLESLNYEIKRLPKDIIAKWKDL